MIPAFLNRYQYLEILSHLHLKISQLARLYKYKIRLLILIKYLSISSISNFIPSKWISPSISKFSIYLVASRVIHKSFVFLFIEILFAVDNQFIANFLLFNFFYWYMLSIFLMIWFYSCLNPFLAFVLICII